MTELIVKRTIQQDALVIGVDSGAVSNEVTVSLTGQELQTGILTEENLNKFRIVPSRIQAEHLNRIRNKLNKRSGRP